MSLNKTPNYGMHSWAPEDYVKREEFNENFNIIDTQMKANKDNADGKAPLVHTHPNATQSTAGFMSATDKTKLDTVDEGAEVNQLAFSRVFVNGTAVSARDKAADLYLRQSTNVTLTADPDTDTILISAKDTTYNPATTTTNGLMSAADKKKLDGVAEGAEVNQNAFSNIVVGTTTISADSKSDTLTLTAGTNVTLTPNATTDGVTITAKDTTYSPATSTTDGLMSKTDKAKLDGVEAGANNYTLPTASSSVLGGVKTGANILNSGGTISVPDASGTQKGVLMLSDSLTNSSVTTAATSNTVKRLYEMHQQSQQPKLTDDDGTTMPTNETDLNNILKTGFYYVPSTAANRPVGRSGTLLVFQYNSTTTVQMFITHVTYSGDMQTFIRFCNNGTWLSWQEYADASKTQNVKLTIDSGGVKINNLSTNTNILDLIINEGIGIHSFYSINAAAGNPPGASSIRGLAHITQTGNGWVFAIDFNNRFFINYLDAGNWKGWKRVADDSVAQMFKLTQDNSRIKIIDSDDLNSVIESGFYYVGSGVLLNKPMSSIGTMLVMQYGASTTMQVFWQMSTGTQRMFVRYCSNGTWGVWTEFANQNTVSELSSKVNALSDYDPSSKIVNYRITLLNGVTQYSDIIGPPIYLKMGKIVEVWGYVTGITTANTKIANIPTGFRPPSERYCAGITSTVTNARFARWKLMTNGDLMMENTSDGKFEVHSNTFWEFHFIYNIEEVAFG